MSGNSNNPPMLKATGLWAKTSVNQGFFLIDRMRFGYAVLAYHLCKYRLPSH
jgi:hypothetical protein